MLCATWRPQSTSTVRKEISAQEKWIDFIKVGIFQRVMAGKNFAALDQGAGAKAASEGVDDLGLVVKDLNKKAQGKYSVTLLLSAKSAEELRENSQLIVITHQRRTMEAADALYGVSMRGDGVSQVISQRMREPELA